MQEQQPPPVQPIPEPPPVTPSPFQNTQTPSPTSLTTGIGSGPRAGAGTESFGRGSASELSAERQIEARSASANVTSGAESQVRNTSDVGDLLTKSISNPNVVVKSQNPISNDPRLRGYRWGQVRSNVQGGYFFSVLQDLDTPLNKFDSSLIQDIITTKGPYSVRQGPGLAFIDVNLLPAPRYENGFEAHGRTAANYNTNGDQWDFRQNVYGGDEDWGFRLGYGHRGGSDYQDGSNRTFASSYNSRDIDFALSIDLTADQRLDVFYNRVDVTKMELPAYLIDLDFLGTDALEINYTAENGSFFDRFTFNSWYNLTEFRGGGGAKNPAALAFNAAFIPTLSQGDVYSTGIRSFLTWGQDGDTQLNVGGDFSYLRQEYQNSVAAGPNPRFGIPRTSVTNPGAFGELSVPASEYFHIKAGARADFVSMQVEQQNLVGNPLPTIPKVDYTLWSTYLSTDYQLNDEWTLLAAAGHGERPPTATDLYGSFPFLGFAQQPFNASFLLGSLVQSLRMGRTDYVLNPEKATQIDLGLKGEYEDFHGGIHFFHSWIDDYITYSDFPGVAGQSEMNPVNTRATLAGGEVFGELNLNSWFSVFSNISYTEGRDQTRNVPLWGIFPLYSYTGVRMKGDRFALELAANIVDNQSRVNPAVGALAGPPATAGDVVEELATGGYTTYDLRGVYQVSDGLALVFGVENFTDKTYQTHLDSRRDFNFNTAGGVFRPGRNYYFGFEAHY